MPAPVERLIESAGVEGNQSDVGRNSRAHDGRIACYHDDLLTGQRVEQGQLLMYLVERDAFVVRAVVDQRQPGKLENGISSANVRLADDITTPLPARLLQQIPAGNHRLPSPALADAGFGGIDVEPGCDSAQTVEQVFHLELTLAHARDEQGLGGRAVITSEASPGDSGQTPVERHKTIVQQASGELT